MVRDAATEVPGGYTPPDLFTGALQHTDPSLTWDETDKRRKKVRTRLGVLCVVCVRGVVGGMETGEGVSRACVAAAHV